MDFNFFDNQLKKLQQKKNEALGMQNIQLADPAYAQKQKQFLAKKQQEGQQIRQQIGKKQRQIMYHNGNIDRFNSLARTERQQQQVQRQHRAQLQRRAEQNQRQRLQFQKQRRMQQRQEQIQRQRQEALNRQMQEAQRANQIRRQADQELRNRQYQRDINGVNLAQRQRDHILQQERRQRLNIPVPPAVNAADQNQEQQEEDDEVPNIVVNQVYDDSNDDGNDNQDIEFNIIPVNRPANQILGIQRVEDPPVNINRQVANQLANRIQQNQNNQNLNRPNQNNQQNQRNQGNQQNQQNQQNQNVRRNVAGGNGGGGGGDDDDDRNNRNNRNNNNNGNNRRNNAGLAPMNNNGFIQFLQAQQNRMVTLNERLHELIKLATMSHLNAIHNFIDTNQRRYNRNAAQLIGKISVYIRNVTHDDIYQFTQNPKGFFNQNRQRFQGPQAGGYMEEVVRCIQAYSITKKYLISKQLILRENQLMYSFARKDKSDTFVPFSDGVGYLKIGQKTPQIIYQVGNTLKSRQELTTLNDSEKQIITISIMKYIQTQQRDLLSILDEKLLKQQVGKIIGLLNKERNPQRNNNNNNGNNDNNNNNNNNNLNNQRVQDIIQQIQQAPAQDVPVNDAIQIEQQ